MNVGPTDRTVRLPGSLSAAAGGGVSGAAGATVVTGCAADGCLPLVWPFCAGGCAICLARSSVTTTSPGSTASSLPSASAQLCPARLQLHDGLNSVRYFSAFGRAVYGCPLIEVACVMSAPCVG